MALVMKGFGQALVETLLEAVERGRPLIRAAVHRVEDAVRPPAGARIVTDDGRFYSGVVVFDHNEPKIWFAVPTEDARVSAVATSFGDTLPRPSSLS